MEVKIDTKEKFHVITIKERLLAANMTADLGNCLMPFLESDIKNLVLNLQDIESIDDAAARTLASAQEQFYDASASFVICGLRPAVELRLDEMGLLDILNATPTESEARDIVQMEEIERELLDGTTE